MRASKKLDFGYNINEQIGDLNMEKTWVVTMKKPWETVVNKLTKKPEPENVLYIENVNIEDLRKFHHCDNSRTIIGVGGGSCIDAAKYLAWRQSASLLIIPTITSVDAMVTSSVAVRKDGVVKYVGNRPPDKIIINFPIIQSAPKKLNRAGIGDILSIHTALFDWELASQESKEIFDEKIASDAKGFLEEALREIDEIRQVTEKGITTLIRAFKQINELCTFWGNPRPEEGSEHFFAYNHEYLTRRHFIHGELVCLGIFIMSQIQENQPDKVRNILKSAQVNYHPSEVGTSVDEITTNLESLHTFVNKQRLYFSIVDKRLPLKKQELAKIIETVLGE